jgi:hypothetical protein
MTMDVPEGRESLKDAQDREAEARRMRREAFFVLVVPLLLYVLPWLIGISFYVRSLARVAFGT